MKKLIEKYWGITICFLLIFVVITLINRGVKNRIKAELQLTKVQLSTFQDSVKVFKSKNDNLTFQLISVNVDKSNLKKALEESGLEIADLKSRNIKWRNIVSTLQAEIKVSSSGSTVLHDTIEINNTDTIKVAEFDWNNRFLFLKGKIFEESMDFDYTYKTGIDILSTKNKKSYVIDVFLDDPNAVITTAHSLTITPKKYWYERPVVWGALGLIGGYVISK